MAQHGVTRLSARENMEHQLEHQKTQEKTSLMVFIVFLIAWRLASVDVNPLITLPPAMKFTTRFMPYPLTKFSQLHKFKC